MISIPVLAVFAAIEALLAILFAWKHPNWLREQPFVTQDQLAEGTLLGEILKHPLRPEDIPAIVRGHCGPLPARKK